MDASKEFREEIAKFLIYHRNNHDFYKSVWKEAQQFEACSSILKNSIIHLIEGPIVSTELGTIISLMEKIKDLSGNVLAFTVMDNFKEFNQKFPLPFKDPRDNQLFEEFFNVLKNEEELFQHVLNVSATVQKALSLIEMIDLSLPSVSVDLLGKKQIERFLQISSEVVGNAAVKARIGAELVQSNEKMWEELEKRSRHLGIQTLEAKQGNDESFIENQNEIEEIFKKIAQWAQENFEKLLYKFNDGTTDFKFLRVAEVSKFWNENSLSYVYAVLEYEYKDAQKRFVSFQIADDGKIVGWNLFEPVKG